ncbi:unnamed protein product [Tuber aestivum]|uniref:Uncharacterized protein n=1 Tax=Tuber aestivum TaxID=59557 RepID=A0A292Q3Z5_9PEZI|nr:unnamed protein product [Tuber aestivum]
MFSTLIPTPQLQNRPTKREETKTNDKLVHFFSVTPLGTAFSATASIPACTVSSFRIDGGSKGMEGLIQLTPGLGTIALGLGAIPEATHSGVEANKQMYLHIEEAMKEEG